MKNIQKRIHRSSNLNGETMHGIFLSKFSFQYLQSNKLVFLLVSLLHSVVSLITFKHYTQQWNVLKYIVIFITLLMYFKSKFIEIHKKCYCISRNSLTDKMQIVYNYRWLNKIHVTLLPKIIVFCIIMMSICLLLHSRANVIILQKYVVLQFLCLLFLEPVQF